MVRLKLLVVGLVRLNLWFKLIWVSEVLETGDGEREEVAVETEDQATQRSRIGAERGIGGGGVFGRGVGNSSVAEVRGAKGEVKEDTINYRR
ncbi:hypothetical protein COLO4_04335 [Corchorus olitorius]|uniref:Uncharacterized protein n=1 Tax=Corchorus olitorius TaxID=93759 RepID=A0A1R3KUE0_9ROSI|nr:hypothetical protein COLO4_06450 [Corchorus olitorius]OMP10713.1 hypothetical protein COLO4_04335 [Corchorus olitorius]